MFALRFTAVYFLWVEAQIRELVRTLSKGLTNAFSDSHRMNVVLIAQGASLLSPVWTLARMLQSFGVIDGALMSP